MKQVWVKKHNDCSDTLLSTMLPTGYRPRLLNCFGEEYFCMMSYWQNILLASPWKSLLSPQQHTKIVLNHYLIYCQSKKTKEKEISQHFSSANPGQFFIAFAIIYNLSWITVQFTAWVKRPRTKKFYWHILSQKLRY